jgi:hypothetical protein
MTVVDNIHENDLVALLVDQSEADLHRGDVGTVIRVFGSLSKRLEECHGL